MPGIPGYFGPGNKFDLKVRFKSLIKSARLVTRIAQVPDGEIVVPILYYSGKLQAAGKLPLLGSGLSGITAALTLPSIFCVCPLNGGRLPSLWM